MAIPSLCFHLKKSNAYMPRDQLIFLVFNTYYLRIVHHIHSES